MADNKLAREVRRLRDLRRINSQEDLAALTGLSRQGIQKLEAGTTEARPSTLFALAQGLAKDMTGAPNPVLAEEYYERLSRAAIGLDPDRPPSDSGDEVTREEMAATLRRLVGRRDVAFALSDVLWSYDRFDDRQRGLLEAAAMLLAHDIATHDGDPSR